VLIDINEASVVLRISDNCYVFVSHTEHLPR